MRQATAKQLEQRASHKQFAFGGRKRSLPKLPYAVVKDGVLMGTSSTTAAAMRLAIALGGRKNNVRVVPSVDVAAAVDRMCTEVGA